ncbi:flagellar motor switch protein FliM [Lutibacter sp. B2]|nr:flagellar motor switch protein FliM [Lutibacter sp. B2]
MSEVLSQSEIDQLLEAINTGELDAQEIKEDINEIKVKKYDFRRPDKFAKEQLRTLQIIHENFCRSLKTFLSGYLRSLVKVDVLSIEQLSNYEFTNSIANPAVLGIVDFSPLEGQIIVDIGPDIAFVFIDRILGGRGEVFSEKRTFTEIELSLIKKVIKEMIKRLIEPWENVIELSPRLEKVETNSQFAQIVSPSETIALITLSIQVGESEGMINICIPHIVIEPIVEKLNTKFWFSGNNKERTTEDEAAISRRIENTKVPIKAVLGTSRITVKEFMGIQIGDVIPLDSQINDDVKVFVGEQLKYFAVAGTNKKKMAIKIKQVIEEGDE